MPEQSSYDVFPDCQEGERHKLVHFAILLGWVDGPLKHLSNPLALYEAAQTGSGLIQYKHKRNANKMPEGIRKEDILLEHYAAGEKSYGMRYLENFMWFQGRIDVLMLRDVQYLHYKQMEILREQAVTLDQMPNETDRNKAMDMMQKLQAWTLNVGINAMLECTQKCLLAHYKYEELKKVLIDEDIEGLEEQVVSPINEVPMVENPPKIAPNSPFED